MNLIRCLQNRILNLIKISFANIELIIALQGKSVKIYIITGGVYKKDAQTNIKIVYRINKKAAGGK